ncbi:coproporphyrinogen-III oxidase family protein [Actinomadura sp.]|uniref:coproporphyrinogen-III oxidase family protein n=1 Tax=Actinomadura sp. TaxID=1989 RepID=UPI0037C70933
MSAGTAEEISALLDREVRADYAYMYPPRQAYGRIEPHALTEAVTRSLEAARGPLNLYLHFPFCEQICGFCNLFSVASSDDDLIDAYIAALLKELAGYADMLRGLPLDTVYLGGGTPSVMSPAQLATVLDGVSEQLGTDLQQVPEVAMEVSPSTVEPAKFREFRRLGINRVNLGFQSLEDAELSGIGRAYASDIPYKALDIVAETGFRNVCVDLIYGLPGQDHAAWRRSVDKVIELGPDTVCAYALTLRPRTGFAGQGYLSVSGPDQYAKYDYADERLRQEGYRRQTHVRWARGEDGGYRQKANHWALQPIVGIGAGARGYLWECDYRNGYSVRHRMRGLRQYLDAVSEHGHGRTDGYLMTPDERRRKALVLALIDLDLDWYAGILGGAPEEHFGPYLDVLEDLALLERSPGTLRLTDRGVRHRDVLVQGFFSPEVRRRLASFDYDE